MQIRLNSNFNCIKYGLENNINNDINLNTLQQDRVNFSAQRSDTTKKNISFGKSTFELLIDKISEYIFPESDYNNKLFLAVVEGNTRAVSKLIETKDVDINLQNEITGDTPLMVASRKGYVQIARKLLKCKGIDVNRKNRLEDTALTIASRYGQASIVKKLLEYPNVDINYINNNFGKSALVEALSNRYPEVAKILLAKEGIDANSADLCCKRTALMYAAREGYTEIVKKLLKRNDVNPNAKDFIGNSALDYARENAQTEIEKILLSS